jgi:preprotein translocase subunit SecE
LWPSTCSAQGALAQWGALLVGLVALWWCFSRPSRASSCSPLAATPGASQEGGVAGPQGSHPDDAYVFAFVVVMALFLWLTDKTLEWVFYDLILGWRK